MEREITLSGTRDSMRMRCWIRFGVWVYSRYEVRLRAYERMRRARKRHTKRERKRERDQRESARAHAREKS